ncbi:MAG: hypothetical protein KAJ19_18800, partial [Gammaproteobacteria bacterium]|nr:hypothetical protein [Gammaproteobacteria bacterium]
EGIPSDRLRVDWWITSPEVENCLGKSVEKSDFQRSIEELEDNGFQLINPPEELSQEYIVPGPQKAPPPKPEDPGGNPP